MRVARPPCTAQFADVDWSIFINFKIKLRSLVHVLNQFKSTFVCGQVIFTILWKVIVICNIDLYGTVLLFSISEQAGTLDSALSE